jgi:hypothetical protein
MPSLIDVPFVILTFAVPVFLYAWNQTRDRKYLDCSLIFLLLFAAYAYTAFVLNVGELAPVIGRAVHYASLESYSWIGQATGDICATAVQGFQNPVLDGVAVLGLVVYSALFTASSLALGVVVKVLSSIANIFRRKS